MTNAEKIYKELKESLTPFQKVSEILDELGYKAGKSKEKKESEQKSKGKSQSKAKSGSNDTNPPQS